MNLAELVDPVASARAAGLRYVSDTQPGIRRKRAGKGFGYRWSSGETVTDRATLARIRALAIPPAWTDVWICPRSNGHLQATGRDARGRKQYRYHEDWRATRDAVKYERMVGFGEALPRIRERVDQDLRWPDLRRERVLATVVRLLELTALRVGNDEYARENHSYGLTTLRTEHAEVEGSVVEFCFRGKSGKQQLVRLADRRLARAISRCQDLPGQELFQYIDADGEPHPIHSEDVNDYIREISGGDYTAKDFRTWNGTLLAARCLALRDLGESETQRRREIVAAVKQVAEELGNTPAVCRKAYIHPAVFEAYEQGGLNRLAQAERDPRERFGLSGEEQALLELLRQAARLSASKAGAKVA
jgi:DNA topoisomerase-1